VSLTDTKCPKCSGDEIIDIEDQGELCVCADCAAVFDVEHDAELVGEDMQPSSIAGAPFDIAELLAYRRKVRRLAKVYAKVYVATPLDNSDNPDSWAALEALLEAIQ
jgi:hypothetical protein